MALASPFTAFSAAAQVTATVGQARSSASYAAWRTFGSSAAAKPRIAAIGKVSAPPGTSTTSLSCEVTSACNRSHAVDPVVLSSA